MDDASTKPRATIAVTRGFECSRLESELLAVAYEHAVPIRVSVTFVVSLGNSSRTIPTVRFD